MGQTDASRTDEMLVESEKPTLEQMSLNRPRRDIRTRLTGLAFPGNEWETPKASARIAASVHSPDNLE
jgi:hypothetical protein